MNIIRSQSGTQTVPSGPASALRSSMSEGGRFDMAKVDRMRTAVAEGSYTVDPGRIASRVMADAKACVAVGIPVPAPVSE